MTIKKVIKTTAQVFLAFIAFVSLYFLAAVTLPLITIPAEPAASNDVTVYILTNGVHTDIVVPVKNEQAD